jgi:hypothetical protein
MTDTLIKYAGTDTVDLTATNLQSLASDANLLAGWKSAAVDNNTNRYVDALVSAYFTVNSTSAPTADTRIEVWAYAPVDVSGGTYRYPSGITDAEGTLTIGSDEEKWRLSMMASIIVNATVNVEYPMIPQAIANHFGGRMPQKWGVFVVHNTGQNLSSSNNVITYQGIKYSDS